MDISFKSEEERKKDEEINRRIRHNRTHRFVYNPVNISTVHEWVGTLAMSCEKYVRMRAEFDGHPSKNVIWANLTVMVKERHINTLEGFLEFMEGENPTIDALAVDHGYDSAGFVKRYLILDAECSKSPNGYGSGYAWSVASVMYVSNGTRRWLTIREFLGEPAYYVTEDPVMDALADADLPGEAVLGDLRHAIGEERDDAKLLRPVVVLVEAFVEFADGQDGGFVGGLRGVEAGDAGGGETEGGSVRG